MGAAWRGGGGDAGRDLGRAEDTPTPECRSRSTFYRDGGRRPLTFGANLVDFLARMTEGLGDEVCVDGDTLGNWRSRLLACDTSSCDGVQLVPTAPVRSPASTADLRNVGDCSVVEAKRSIASKLVL